jgi:hypothetical protein
MGPSRFTIRQAMTLIALVAVELGLLPTPFGVAAVAVTLVLALLCLHPDGRAFAQILGSMAAVLAVGSLLLWALASLLVTSKWIGLRPLPLTFTVADSETGRPVPGASVRLFGAVSPKGPVVMTGADGRVAVAGEYWATGSSGALGESGSVGLSRCWARASAEGYETAWMPLAVPLGPRRDLHGASPPIVGIDLVPAKAAPAGPLADLAGGYFRGTPDGRCTSLWLTADGTYRWVTREEGGYAERSRGVARRSGGLLLLDSHRPAVLWPVRWGGRMYLLEGDQIAGLNRGGEEPRSQPFGPFFLREDDWAARPAGDPIIPAEIEGGPVGGESADRPYRPATDGASRVYPGALPAP